MVESVRPNPAKVFRTRVGVPPPAIHWSETHPDTALETVTLGNAQAVEPMLDGNRELTIDGSFRYQACDDRECFPPESVALRWKVKVQPFDRTRVPEELQRKASGYAESPLMRRPRVLPL